MKSIVVVVKNGTEKMRFPGKTMPDGSIRVLASGKWMPVTYPLAWFSTKASPVKGYAHMGDNGYGLQVYPAAEWDAIQGQKRTEQAAALEAAVPGYSDCNVESAD
jgi:hypothetical protein